MHKNCTTYSTDEFASNGMGNVLPSLQPQKQNPQPDLVEKQELQKEQYENF